MLEMFPSKDYFFPLGPLHLCKLILMYELSHPSHFVRPFVRPLGTTSSHCFSSSSKFRGGTEIGVEFAAFGR